MVIIFDKYFKIPLVIFFWQYFLLNIEQVLNLELRVSLLVYDSNQQIFVVKSGEGGNLQLIYMYIFHLEIII